ncbi:MAG TPA: hypothetical protein VF691_02535 [Cytophagaceae bacterium]
MRIILFLLAVLPLDLSAQYRTYKKQISAISNRVVINKPESTVYTFVYPKKPKGKADEDLYYYWFGGNDIKRTRGGYDGKLLHGEYTASYFNKNLKEKGKIKKGLRKGKWKSWYENGEFKEICRYRNGSKIRFIEFDSLGAPLRSGKYKRDKLNGNIKAYYGSDSVQKAKYKNGKSIVKIKKVKKEKSKGKMWKVFKRERNDKDRLIIAPEVLPNAEIHGADVEKGQLKSKKKKIAEPKKEKAKKEKKDDVRIRKFLWIIPLSPSKEQEKQT